MSVPQKKTEASVTLAKLFEQSLDGMVPQEQLNIILNTAPPEQWVKVHPYIKNHKYIPINKVEYLMQKIFKRWRVEVLKTGMLMNAVEVTVRVHYFNPAINDMDYHDGVGAVELQTISESGPLKLDMSNVNRGAVAMALPLAKSVAIKDACDHFGPLFGRDLNRKDAIAYMGDAAFNEAAEHRETLYKNLQELYQLKKDALGENARHIERIIANKEADKYESTYELLQSL